MEQWRPRARGPLAGLAAGGVLPCGHQRAAQSHRRQPGPAPPRSHPGGPERQRRTSLRTGSWGAHVPLASHPTVVG